MAETASPDLPAKPKRPRLQFGLAGLLLFVLFAASVGAVVVRWERWAVERIATRRRSDGAFMILRGIDDSFEFQAGPRIFVNLESGKEVSVSAVIYVLIGQDKLVTTDANNDSKIWDWNTGHSISLQGRIKDGVLSPDGKKLLAPDYRNRVWNVFNTVDGLISTERIFDEAIFFSSFSSDGTYAVFRMSKSRNQLIWNLVRDTFIIVPEVLSFTNDCRGFICNSTSSGLFVHDANDGSLIRQINSPEISGAGRIKYAYKDQLFIAVPKASLEFFDKNGARIATLPWYVSHDVHEIASDGRHLLVNVTNFDSGPETPQICDLNGALSGPFEPSYGTRFSPDGTKIYTLSKNSSEIFIRGQRFPDGPLGHLTRPEVWLAFIFGSLWLYRAAAWLRRRRADSRALRNQRN